MTRRPWLIVCTGLPGSGKSTLARAVAAHLQIALFEKDGFKEQLFDVLGWRDRAWSKQLSIASVVLLIDAADRVLRSRQSVLVESNVDPAYDQQRLCQLVDRHQARVLVIVCTCPGELLVERFLGRTRHPGHGDAALAAEVLPQLRAGVVAVPQVGGQVLTIDTRTPTSTSVAQIVALIHGSGEDA